jgi:hypothetical protein
MRIWGASLSAAQSTRAGRGKAFAEECWIRI